MKLIESVNKELSKVYNPQSLKEFFNQNNENLSANGLSLRDIIKRNNIDIFKVRDYFNLFKDIPNNILDYINTEIKYEGYIKKEEKLIDKTKSLEDIKLPDINFMDISGLRIEARQKLNKFKPNTLGQAKRIDGVSPSDISVLMVYLKM